MEYLIHIAVLCCLALMLSLSFNLSFGVARLLNLAHFSFFAVGAYATALLSVYSGFGIELCLPLSLLSAGVLSLIVGSISLRLSDDYFAIGSLACHSVIVALLINWKSVTNGVLGIPGIPRPRLFGVELLDNSQFLIFAVGVVALVGLALCIINLSPFARSLRAQAQYQFAAESLGLHSAKLRILAFVLSSIGAGVAGSCFAYYINYIDPSSFSLGEMLVVLTAVIMGRPGSFWGVAAATIFLVLVPEALRFVELPSSILGPMRQMLYAIILFAVVWYRRDQLVPKSRVV